MEILKDVYLDTDKVLKGVEYSIIYRGKIFKDNIDLKTDDKTIIKINDSEIQMKKTDYGYKAVITFLEQENDFSVERDDFSEKYTIYTQEASNDAIEYIYGNNELKLMPKKIQIIPEQLITVISKTMKIIPRLLGKTLNIKDLFESKQ